MPGAGAWPLDAWSACLAVPVNLPALHFAVDGEKDPRCLLLCFDAVRCLLDLYHRQPEESLCHERLEVSEGAKCRWKGLLCVPLPQSSRCCLLTRTLCDLLPSNSPASPLQQGSMPSYTLLPALLLPVSLLLLHYHCCLTTAAEHLLLSQEGAEELFEVLACYFPVTFTPPPGDPNRWVAASKVVAARRHRHSGGCLCCCRTGGRAGLPALLPASSLCWRDLALSIACAAVVLLARVQDHPAGAGRGAGGGTGG
jgi:hypothetical protein